MVDALCIAPGGLSLESSDDFFSGVGDNSGFSSPAWGLKVGKLGPLSGLGGGGGADHDAAAFADSPPVSGVVGGFDSDSAPSSSFVMYQAGGV
jgi:hypothetical protein